MCVCVVCVCVLVRIYDLTIYCMDFHGIILLGRALEQARRGWSSRSQRDPETISVGAS